MAVTTDQVLMRRRMLIGSFLVGWIAWYGFLILRETGLQDFFGSAADIIIGVIGMGGWLVFAVSLYKIMTVKRRYKNDPTALAALQDERFDFNKKRATRNGFFILIATQILLVLFGGAFGFSAVAGAHITIFIGVAAMMASFLWFDLSE